MPSPKQKKKFSIIKTRRKKPDTPIDIKIGYGNAGVAQLVEHRSEKPGVDSSILSPSIFLQQQSSVHSLFTDVTQRVIARSLRDEAISSF